MFREKYSPLLNKPQRKQEKRLKYSSLLLKNQLGTGVRHAEHGRPGCRQIDGKTFNTQQKAGETPVTALSMPGRLRSTAKRGKNHRV